MSDRNNDVDLAQIRKLDAETDFLKSKKEAQDLIGENMRDELVDQRASAEENGIYIFYSPVNQTSAGVCMQTLGFWARRQAASSEEDPAPFTIEICSPGGDVMAGFALIDYVRALQRDGFVINTLGLGFVASMASVILQGGDHRMLGKNSYLLIHEIQAGSGGSLSMIEDETKFYGRLNERIYELLADRSHLDVKEIKRRAKRKDWWLDSDEAIEYGFVDEVQ